MTAVRRGWRQLVSIAAGAPLTCALAAIGLLVNAPLLLGAAAASPLGATLALRPPALLHGEPWRLLTGHVVHFTREQAVLGLFAFVVLAALAERELAGRFGAVLAASALAIALAVALTRGSEADYRGASGLESGLLCALVVARLRAACAGSSVVDAAAPLLAACALAAKVLYEAACGTALFAPGIAEAGVAPSPEAHAAGALGGLLIALLPGARRRPSVSEALGDGPAADSRPMAHPPCRAEGGCAVDSSA